MIGITLGDACGVGPELLVRAAAEGLLCGPWLVYGERAAIDLACEKLKLKLNVHEIASPAAYEAEALNLINLGLLAKQDITIGQVSGPCGAAAIAAIDRAGRDALDEKISAICTLPIHKEACAISHPGFIGHTEFIAQLCGEPHPLMTLIAPDLVTTYLSTHLSLRDALDQVTRENILRVIRQTAALTKRLQSRCRIGVAGLNPHAGENGAFGREEIDVIAPAVQTACAEGIDAVGPLVPDAMLPQAFKGAYDAIVMMYHDQGHIPMKLTRFENSVNVTAGLPIVRTSVDHGTAFDIAYQGIASTENLMSAFFMAQRLSRKRS